MKKNTLDNFKDSYNKDFKFHDENIQMLTSYAERVINTLTSNKAESLLSLGIGHEIVSKSLMNKVKNYHIIEGSGEIIKNYISNLSLPNNVKIQETYFEDFECNLKFDAIEMGFVLEHVEDPLLVLKKFSKYLKEDGTIFIAVPNARSLHRQVGYEAGLLDDIYSLSKEDLELGHKRYFDLESIIQLINESGLKIRKIEGIMLKPLTTSQINSLNLLKEVINALMKLSVNYPDISNSIYIEAQL